MLACHHRLARVGDVAIDGGGFGFGIATSTGKERTRAGPLRGEEEEESAPIAPPYAGVDCTMDDFLPRVGASRVMAAAKEDGLLEEVSGGMVVWWVVDVVVVPTGEKWSAASFSRRGTIGITNGASTGP